MDPRATIAEHARLTRERLPTGMLPYWLEVSRDDAAGGFLLHDDVPRGPARRAGRFVLKGRRTPPSDDKQLVTQARLVWVFAQAHRKGYDVGTTYLDAAERGRQFLLEHFLDPERGGYRWMTDRGGRVVNDVKLFYAQAFVIYAFVELARASGQRESLDDALALFRVIERELHDDAHGGWREQAEDDWSPVPTPPASRCRGTGARAPTPSCTGSRRRLSSRSRPATSRSGARSSRRSTSPAPTCSRPIPATRGSPSSPPGRRIRPVSTCSRTATTSSSGG